MSDVVADVRRDTETENLKENPHNTDHLPDCNSVTKNNEETDDLISEKSERDRSDESSDESDEISANLEREEGDGQESIPNRKVDDDEDKRNPQYIPKRGTFYEHDDRTAVEESLENPESSEKDRTEKDAVKKKVWLDKENSRWMHDKYNDQEQAPKSKSELIAIYGYDIRNEEGPPRARRRRRYGRGPNKYTRNWEDEEAYTKPVGVVTKVTPRKNKLRSKGEEFPPLVEERDQQQTHGNVYKPHNDSVDVYRNTSSEIQESIQRVKVADMPSKNLSKIEQPPLENTIQDCQTSQHTQRNEMKLPRNNLKSKPDESGCHTRGITKSRGFKSGGRINESQTKNQKIINQHDEFSDYIMTQNYTNKSINQSQNVRDIEKDMGNMSVQDNGFSGRSGKFTAGQRQNSVPPRLQAEQRGSKRYSSLRQRSLPETVASTFNQHNAYYAPEFNQQNPQQQSQQGLLPHPSPSIHSQISNSNNQQLVGVTPSTQGINSISHQGQAGNGTLLAGPPPQYAQPFAQPAAFLQTGVTGPPFIPQQPPPPQILNYAQPSPFTQPTPYANYQHQQFNPVNQGQPTELYQPQGGITYYSTQNQQVIPRIATKRPKAAIPIVPPPEHKEPRGRGRLNKSEEQLLGGMSESPSTSSADVFIDENQQNQSESRVESQSATHYQEQDTSINAQQ